MVYDNPYIVFRKSIMNTVLLPENQKTLISLGQLSEWTSCQCPYPEKTIVSLARDLSSAQCDQVTFLSDEIARPIMEKEKK